ncbi:MAG TPA: T9SS type A sorting domain-containing protein, partial [Lutibacter sp.]|nr:T9SS type A sorting domain-containing protein [Lutibacter sp.]
QQNADLPFLNCVNVDSSGYVVNNSFQQYYNHYHCPVLPIYSATNNEMHNVFFGGIAQYYDSNGILVQDDNVPFVNTIARVTRNSAGVMTEYKLPITMPALLGSGAEFIPNLTIPHYNNEVFKLDSLTDGDTVLIGYIYGGISSTAPNIFFINDGTQSSASSQIFKVFITKGDVLSIDELNVNSTNSLNMTVYPNPANQNITVNYNLKKSSNVKISIFDIQGKLIKLVKLNNIGSGEHSEKINIESLTNKSIYIIQVETEYERFIEKIIIED